MNGEARTGSSTELLIEFENSESSLLFEESPGTSEMLWPLLRWPLWRQLAKDEFGLEGVPGGSDRSAFIRRAARGIVRPRLAVPTTARSADQLFLVSGNTQGVSSGVETNWLVDEYAMALGDEGLVIQERPLSARPRRFAPTVSMANTLAALELRLRATSRLQPRSTFARDYVEEVVRAFPNASGRVDAQRLAHALAHQLRWSTRYRDAYLRIIDTLQPSVIYLQTASYGDKSPLIEALRARQIIVAEHQHGWIGPFHAAYNFGQAFQRGRLRSVLPQVLVTFGDYWAEGLRFPNQVVVAGKPHLDSRVRAAAAWESRPKSVLAVSSVAHPELMQQRVLDLAAALPADWSVRFRPHPGERQVVATRYPELSRSARVEFDLDPDVYDSLASARAVVGTLSTVLYEALAFSCTVVPIEDPLTSAYLGGAFGEAVSGAKNIAHAVQLPPESRLKKFTQLREAIWASSDSQSLREAMETVKAGHRDERSQRHGTMPDLR